MSEYYFSEVFPELPLRMEPQYVGDLQFPLVTMPDGSEGILRFMTQFYDPLEHWERTVQMINLVAELPAYGIPTVEHTLFMAKDPQDRPGVAVVAKFLSGQILGDAYEDNPEATRPAIDQVVAGMTNYYTQKFLSGEPSLVDISRYDQHMLTSEGPLLIDLEGLATSSIEEVRDEEGEDSSELLEAEALYAKLGQAGIYREVAQTELQFLKLFYKDKASPDVYARVCEAVEMADSHMSAALAG